MRDQLQKLTVLERTLNAGLEDKPFGEKQATYGASAFALTRELSGRLPKFVYGSESHAAS
jgi:hypothetical protein